MNPRCKDITRFGHNNCFILRLPIELQTQIFIECASYPYGQLMIEHEVPQVLLLVCKYWRDLAYATSRLWSSFEIHFGTWEQNFKGTEGDARILSRVRLWLRRSGNYPLHVKLFYKPLASREGTLSRFPSEMLVLLMQHCSRWQDIELSMPSSCFAPLSSAAPALDLSSLSSLVLNSIPSIHSEFLDVRNLASNCGKLTRLHINFESGRVLTLDDCGVIFAQHPNLSCCKLYAQCLFDGSSEHSGHAVDKFILPALSELHLSVYSRSSHGLDNSSSPQTALTMFLNRLELYVLISLRIEWFVDNDRSLWTSCHPSFVTFLEAVEPTLETLSLGYLPLSEEQLIDCLRATSYVTSAELLFSLGEEIEGPAITDKLLRALTFICRSGSTSISEPLLCMLQSLTLQCHGKGCSEQELVRFLNSRSDRQPHTLQTLKLQTQSPILSGGSRWIESGINVIEDCV
ncbi:uncharacterized protein C8R40DRAFT_1177188 [Lentinula edodes]|uniref:uncharacterized protein n=1 Tax=Lentinula edodes TaxID=5353 RepID=UPI001E8D12CF|nr:uncharacterized protein C8R40DRAFT_1177188 [Lentinula edodes]KAH7869063.1 hypothetical protein C8R40DRAFT_1177188 [Lentinula edodes]